MCQDERGTAAGDQTEHGGSCLQELAARNDQNVTSKTRYGSCYRMATQKEKVFDSKLSADKPSQPMMSMCITQDHLRQHSHNSVCFVMQWLNPPGPAQPGCACKACSFQGSTPCNKPAQIQLLQSWCVLQEVHQPHGSCFIDKGLSSRSSSSSTDDVMWPLPSVLSTAVCGRPSKATWDTAATLKLLPAHYQFVIQPDA